MTNDNSGNDAKEVKDVTKTADMEDGAQTSEDSPHFDMYHFFSRKDVLLVAVVILFVLLYLIWAHLFSPESV